MLLHILIFLLKGIYMILTFISCKRIRYGEATGIRQEVKEREIVYVKDQL